MLIHANQSFDLMLALTMQPDLGSDKDVISWNQFAVDEVVKRFTQRLFGVVDERRIKMSISNLERRLHRFQYHRPVDLNNKHLTD